MSKCTKKSNSCVRPCTPFGECEHSFLLFVQIDIRLLLRVLCQQTEGVGCANSLFFIFDQVCNIAAESLADLVKQKAVVPNDLVFVIIVDDLKFDPGTLGKLVARDIVLIQIFRQSQSDHFITSLRYIL